MLFERCLLNILLTKIGRKYGMRKNKSSNLQKKLFVLYYFIKKSRMFTFNYN